MRHVHGMNILKKTYNWVLGWADSRWGAAALFVLAFAESSFFPIPPDVLLIALGLGCAAKAFRYALICTIGSVLGAMAGYALARTKTKMGNRMFLFFLAGLIVPFQMNIVSLYKIVKSLHLMNTPFAVILVNVAINTPQAVFLFKEFIEGTVPKELEEAAEIDGCTVFRKFFRVVLPLLTPVISTVVIIVTLNVWNEFMTPLLFLQSREKDVILQEVSRNIGQFATDWTALFPMLMLGVAPLMIFYVFMQKYIIAGVAAGAVKG